MPTDDTGGGIEGRSGEGASPFPTLPNLGEAVTQLPDHWRDLGEFIREQRAGARLSLRRLSDLAGVSNPYLSQIERGLRRPSAEILQQIARALRISAETLYVRAGILEERSAGGDLVQAVLGDATLTDEQKHALLRIVASFRRENGTSPAPAGAGRVRRDAR
ncbi:MAG TPA: helix-turn-helix transcriptional regulator [Acidimicrobiales bacterium]|jgi:transcriptional regulator with XRE-family HTH domain|nr:helix-turn-helix transcriptional regulator [Acidimicrobiales bacterium]